LLYKGRCRGHHLPYDCRVKQVSFGSFAESEGFTGLAHEQSWPVGTRVSVRILAIDPERQRFSLAPA
jgi:hypothetical protein